jgi:hypothetical protein
MGIIQFLFDKEGSAIVLDLLQSQCPVALEVLDALEPAIPGLCRVLQKHGVSTIGGVDIAEFIQAVADKEAVT